VGECRHRIETLAAVPPLKMPRMHTYGEFSGPGGVRNSPHRNLPYEEMGGVIFGCTKETLKGACPTSCWKVGVLPYSQLHGGVHPLC
jgi:hypothetical protein